MIPPRIIIARAARHFGLNLNWIFAPVTAWTRQEPLTLRGLISARQSQAMGED